MLYPLIMSIVLFLQMMSPVKCGSRSSFWRHRLFKMLFPIFMLIIIWLISHRFCRFSNTISLNSRYLNPFPSQRTHYIGSKEKSDELVNLSREYSSLRPKPTYGIKVAEDLFLHTDLGEISNRRQKNNASSLR